MFESKSGIFLIAGIVFFVFSFLVMAVVPWTIYKGEPELTLAALERLPIGGPGAAPGELPGYLLVLRRRG